MTTLEPENKLELTRQEAQELRIYFMIGRMPIIEIMPGPFPRPPQIEEKIIPALAYKLEDAFEKLKVKEPGYTLFYHGQNITVKDFLAQLQIQEVVSMPTDKEPAREVESLPPEKIKFDNFKYDLLLVVDEYVRSEDRNKLKRIINGLEYVEGHKSDRM